MMKMRRLWNSWDDSQKSRAVKVTGLVLGLVTLFVFISCVSYLFTWKSDQSLLHTPDAISPAVGVNNTGAKFGHGISEFLMCRLFGLGSFALVFVLAAVSVRLLFKGWRYSLLKTFNIALAGGMVSSLVLSLAGIPFGGKSWMGGGLGGKCGSFLVDWSLNLIGPVFTTLLVLLVLVLFLTLVSGRFASWCFRENASSDAEDEDTEEVPVEDGPDDGLSAAVASAAEPSVEYDDVEAATDGEDEDIEVSGTENPETEDSGVAEEPVAEGDSGSLEVIRGEGLSVDVKKPLPRIDVRKEEVPSFNFPPPLDILEDHSFGKREVTAEEIQRNNNKIRASLANYKIQIDDCKAVVGPTVTLYKVYPSAGVRISEIKKLQDDIALSLNAKGVRVVTLEDSVGIEVANDNAATVPLKALLNAPEFRESKAELPVAIGYTITQKVKVFDLADAPHLLVAGATKQGKSVGLNVIVSSLLYAKHPSELKFVFIDPKMVEFSSYAHLLKHYLAVLPNACSEQDERLNAIVKKTKDAESVLRSLCIEMDERYELLSSAYVNNIKTYNDKFRERHLLPTEGHRFLPYIVVVVDEYADLTMSTGGSPEAKAASRSIQNSIIRLAQKGRAAGLHVILATQRPSVDVISGIIKANFPTRIAFRVTSRVDSTTILDQPGAEKLIGRGDMLYYSGVDMERVQCGYVSGDEISAITRFIGSQTGYKKCYNTPYYLPDPAPEGGEGGGMVDMSDLDERFVEAAKQVVISQRGSTSDLQRKLGMGYAKAGRVMDQLEAAGIVGPQDGSKPRQVLVSDLETLEQIIKAYVK